MKQNASTQWEPFLRLDKSVQTGHEVREFGKGLRARKKLFGRSDRFVPAVRSIPFLKCQRLQTDKIKKNHKWTQSDEVLRLSTTPGPQYIPTPKFLLGNSVSPAPKSTSPVRGSEVFILMIF
ncbi:hypothetical protein QAD02_007311 [Eretmocerus hayati]|uniref:Uncharacterized protein n=1 Tax=Eretmocerus hayati TaxID=131215 RepID=A0ACC2N379_9HYME|nr:hypothetical protein QAD02_007311 [Eretmocerus hayati]